MSFVQNSSLIRWNRVVRSFFEMFKIYFNFALFKCSTQSVPICLFFISLKKQKQTIEMFKTYFRWLIFKSTN